MDKTPLVSIIIPCYNYEKYIEQCIRSALNQTYSNIEVVIVDNGSTDQSLNKIKTFLYDDRVSIIELKQNIPPGSRNGSAVGSAIKISKGEFISILYADDWYMDTKIEKQIDLFQQTPKSVGLVYCHGYRYSEKYKFKSKEKYQSVKGYAFIKYLTRGDVVIPISPLVKRYCYSVIGLDNPWTGSEYDFLIMSQYVDFDYVNEHLVVMRDHKVNDAKNTHSVFKRLKCYHSMNLLTNGAKSRAGSLASKRVSADYMSFGMRFITLLDISNAKKAIFTAIKLYPKHLFSLKVLISIILLLAPLSMTKYLLQKSGKLF